MPQHSADNRRAVSPSVPPSRQPARLAAVLLALVYLACLLPGLGDFGPTWDLALADYGYGEQFLAYATTLDPAFIDFDSRPPRPEVRAPHPDLLGGGSATPDIAYPLGGMLSALSCRVFWHWTAMLPAMVAHHLPAPLLTALLLATLVIVGTRGRALSAGVAAALLAALSPYFLAHSAFNIKDVPETCLYTWTYLALATALLATLPARGTSAGAASARPASVSPVATRAWAATAVLFGLALAQKPNALFVPVQGGLLWLALRLARARAGDAGPRFPWRGVTLVLIVAPLVYLLVSPYEWIDTWARGVRHWRLILADGTTLTTGDRLLGLKYVLQTTPLPVLAFALIGVCDRRLARETRCVWLIGLALPLLRTLLPVRIHDGVRHFLEFFPFLCLWAGVGLASVLQRVSGLFTASRVAAPIARAAVWLAALLPGVHAVLDTWPHGVCYYNALAGIAPGAAPGESTGVSADEAGSEAAGEAAGAAHGVSWGGLAGARAAGLPDATDAWCGSYWQGLQWLAEHAEPGASVLVPVGRHVVICAAPLRLRADLELVADGGSPPHAPLYVMAVTRDGVHQPLMVAVARSAVLVHEIRVQGAPILTIHRVDATTEVVRLFALFESSWNAPLRLLLPALAGVSHLRPELFANVGQALAADDRPALRRAIEELRAELPPLARAALDAVLAQLPSEAPPPPPPDSAR